MSKMKVDFSNSYNNGEPKNRYWGLTLGRVKRMIRGKGMKLSYAGKGHYNIIRDGEYVGAFYPARKDIKSRLYTWPLSWKK